jgi:hypothetical protein
MTFLFKRIAVADLHRHFDAVLLGIADFKDEIKKQLKGGAIRRAQRDRQLAAEWMSLENEELIRCGE